MDTEQLLHLMFSPSFSGIYLVICWFAGTILSFKTQPCLLFLVSLPGDVFFCSCSFWIHIALLATLQSILGDLEQDQ